MSIDKFWFSEDDGTFIAVNDEILYSLKSKKENAHIIRNELDQGIINSKFIGLPFAYIRTIEFRSDNDRLQIKYSKDSEDEIIIADHGLRNDVFEYLANKDQVRKYTSKKPTLISRIKNRSLL